MLPQEKHPVSSAHRYKVIVKNACVNILCINAGSTRASKRYTLQYFNASRMLLSKNVARWVQSLFGDRPDIAMWNLPGKKTWWAFSTLVWVVHWVWLLQPMNIICEKFLSTWICVHLHIPSATYIREVSWGQLWGRSCVSEKELTGWNKTSGMLNLAGPIWMIWPSGNCNIRLSLPWNNLSSDTFHPMTFLSWAALHVRLLRLCSVRRMHRSSRTYRIFWNLIYCATRCSVSYKSLGHSKRLQTPVGASAMNMRASTTFQK